MEREKIQRLTWEGEDVIVGEESPGLGGRGSDCGDAGYQSAGLGSP
jgi:hypothetical protein